VLLAVDNFFHQYALKTSRRSDKLSFNRNKEAGMMGRVLGVALCVLTLCGAGGAVRGPF